MIHSINTKSDKWILKHPTTLGKTISFDFSYLPNKWFKQAHKQITIESMIIKKPSIETINRYNTALKRFFDFIKKYGISLKNYEELTHHHVQMYLFELKQHQISNATKQISLSALKWIIEYGTHFEYDGFPKNIIFDGDEYSAVKSEDILKTKYIPDNVMKQIEKALFVEKNKLLKSLIEIGIDTGIRLSEALELKRGCITEDFTGKPVLHVVSPKNKTERFIPVSQRVKKAIQTLEEISEEGRKAINSDNLTVYWLAKGKPPRYDRLFQPTLRQQLYTFTERHNIRDSDGEIFHLTYHAFRHTLGTEMLNRGMSIYEIADYLGHESLHSTAGYAKLKNPTVQKAYKKLGFVGMIVEEISEQSIGKGKSLDSNTLRSASLPDGACKKPIDNQGNVCAKFNMCIICPKFITTPEHLPIHKEHLKRLRADREKYMASEYIGTQNHLEMIENALETIIERLEEMKNGE